jgi:hypothetical protein
MSELIQRVGHAIAECVMSADLPAATVGKSNGELVVDGMAYIPIDDLALAAIAAVQEWQPIATAPRDGTRICLAEWFDGGAYPEDAHWHFYADYWRKYLIGGEGFGQPRKPSFWTALPSPPSSLPQPNETEETKP